MAAGLALTTLQSFLSLPQVPTVMAAGPRLRRLFASPTSLPVRRPGGTPGVPSLQFLANPRLVRLPQAP